MANDYGEILKHAMYINYNLNTGVERYITKYNNEYFYIMIRNFEFLHTKSQQFILSDFIV